MPDPTPISHTATAHGGKTDGEGFQPAINGGAGFEPAVDGGRASSLPSSRKARRSERSGFARLAGRMPAPPEQAEFDGITDFHATPLQPAQKHCILA
ncbi:MAG: hypothetical protein ACOC3G_02755 [Phycisphaeraceae bacterium]